MELLHLFWAFLVSNVLGYGGGPASIPFMQSEIVDHYHWMSNPEFMNVLAMANALPGPIATKLAGFTGFAVSGWPGLLTALVATVVPSAVAVVLLLRLVRRFRQSAAVRGMTLLIQPVIGVLMVAFTWEVGRESVGTLGWVQSLGIVAVTLWALQKRGIHPAFVIVGAFIYGAVVVPHIH
ncbi:chromate transporter [Kyrpidia spormannii]|uniref:Chromate transporter subunit C n=2 Tax=Kyrpidia spormannii TaxID=2055160 RepID=A0ACA8Z612_9BACL|nr:chromate transporter [Kyrpidia spormannii]CAB3389446.1 chromate transporter subunit C [Kyrpidia spormannii]CAB3390176.1 chromate transporter subunit C [Kyrpidia spormannii]